MYLHYLCLIYNDLEIKGPKDKFPLYNKGVCLVGDKNVWPNPNTALRIRDEVARE